MKMSNLLLACVTTVALQESVFAEDYYVPIKKELEGMARLPMSSFQINNDGMKYTLPRDITGTEVKVELKRNFNLSTDSTRVYEGPLAGASCMGDDKLPACVITHKNLNIDAKQVDAFLESKYVDPARLTESKMVSQAFISGNQPIGFISKRALLPAKDSPKKWTAELLRQGTGTSMLPEISGDLTFSSDSEGQFVVQGRSYRVTNVGRDALHIKGILNCCTNSQSFRWFDVFMSTDKSSLEGSWGRFDGNGKPLPAVGVIRGKEVK